MVFHNLWKEKTAIPEQKSKKRRKCRRFFPKYVENHVENVDKIAFVFPQKYVER